MLSRCQRNPFTTKMANKTRRSYATEKNESGTEIRIRNPALGSVFETITFDTLDDVEDKVALVNQGRGKWREVGLEGRIEIIARFRDILKQKEEELAVLLTKETGKPITQSRNEIRGTRDRVKFFEKNVRQVVGDQVVFEGDGMQEIIQNEPLGVVANISAWNYPYFVGSNVYIPALLTGNTVLYKPSEHAIVNGLKMAELLYEAGVPQDVFVPIIGSGEAGRKLVRSEVDGVYFTGSHKTGVEVAEAAFQNKLVERIQLELGGKDPVYVHNDVDINWAAESIMDGAFYNNGQGCCSVERLYLHEDIHDKFLEVFISKIEEKKIGDPMDETVYFGPLTRHNHVTYLIKQIEDAKANGGTVLTGGSSIQSPENVSYIQPTVISNTNHQMLLMTEESFGPIVGVQKVSSPEEAITQMNDTDYGLTAAVYSKDQAIANSILSKVNVGTAYWNCCDRISPRLPWSGRKDSGIGVTLSEEGIRTFTIPKAWHRKTPE